MAGSNLSVVSKRKSFRISERNVHNFDECIATACTKYQTSHMIIRREERTIVEEPRRLGRKSEVGMMKTPRLSSIEKKSSSTISAFPSISTKSSRICDVTSIEVKTIYTQEELVEIQLKNQDNIPKTAIQILGLVIPYFKHVTIFTIKHCQINPFIIYELTKLLPKTSITQLTLDFCRSSVVDFSKLLEGQCQLTYLSLQKCNIDDETCSKIASHLHFLKPAEDTLTVLNLSSNLITDKGVEQLGLALRSNRHLRYLNLADNSINDDGAHSIFKVLVEFPLTCEEITNQRRMFFDYLKKKRDAFLNFFNNLDIIMGKKKVKKEITKSHFKTTKSSKNFGDELRMKAESFANEYVGPYVHPFTNDFTNLSDNGAVCSRGNFVLCYLNLSYNNLTHFCLKELTQVLKYQSHNKKPSDYGLTKIVVDGNPMPENDRELIVSNKILSVNMANLIAKNTSESLKKKSTNKLVTI